MVLGADAVGADRRSPTAQRCSWKLARLDYEVNRPSWWPAGSRCCIHSAGATPKISVASALIDPLPNDVAALSHVIQGLGIYDVVARDFYGFEAPENRLAEIHLRPIAERLETEPALAVEDWLRAEYVHETYWNQYFLGDSTPVSAITATAIFESAVVASTSSEQRQAAIGAHAGG